MTLRVFSYNIHKGFNTLGQKFVLHEMKEGFKSLNLDLVLLQEVVGQNTKHQKRIPSWPKETQFEFLADSLWPAHAYGKNAVFTESHHGNATLSKFAIESQRNTDLTVPGNRLEMRGALHCIIPISTQKCIHTLNVHLNLRARDRRWQLQKIIEYIEAKIPSHAPLILGGDFNDWGQDATALLSSASGLHEAFSETQQSHATSFPSFFPMLKLDRLYFRNLKVSSARTLNEFPWTRLSDHLPLLCEFEI